MDFANKMAPGVPEGLVGVREKGVCNPLKIELLAIF